MSSRTNQARSIAVSCRVPAPADEGVQRIPIDAAQLSHRIRRFRRVLPPRRQYDGPPGGCESGRVAGGMICRRRGHGSIPADLQENSPAPTVFHRIVADARGHAHCALFFCSAVCIGWFGRATDITAPAIAERRRRRRPTAPAPALPVSVPIWRAAR
jgi:hypothetical protein